MRLNLISGALAAAAAVAVAGCNGSGPRHAGKPLVVAAENFWGSLAAQVAGERAVVRTLLTDPGADPHNYEPTPADARAIASATLVVVNGIGYDAWAQRLSRAAGAPSDSLLDVGRLLHAHEGDNPHVWYSPAVVGRVIDALAAALARHDPPGGAYYRARARALTLTGFAPYRRALETLRRRFGGVSVGASESIFAPLATAAGLRLITPAGFTSALSEGVDPAAGDRAAVANQIDRRQIAVWVVNSQNGTPDVARLTAAAHARQIPVVTVTETLSPSHTRFQDWQTRQLRALVAALGRATGR